MHHHLLVHLHSETEVSIVVINHSTPMLDQSNLKVAWHKGVKGVLYVVNEVESTLASVVMVRQVFLSVVKRVT